MITPRSPPAVSSVSMPAAERAMQRKVPIRLIWMMRSKASDGKCLIWSGASLERDAVLMALPVPAQLTRMRSWPMAARALAKPASTSASEVTLTWQNTPPSSRASASPFSTFRSNSATRTPCAASARAVAAPRPEAPPVTTADTDALSSMPSFPCVLCLAGQATGSGAHARDL
ncbi:hypothetical protein D3C81_1673780 [compost metagenome]